MFRAVVRPLGVLTGFRQRFGLEGRECDVQQHHEVAVFEDTKRVLQREQAGCSTRRSRSCAVYVVMRVTETVYDRVDGRRMEGEVL